MQSTVFYKCYFILCDKYHFKSAKVSLILAEKHLVYQRNFDWGKAGHYESADLRHFE